MRSRPAMHLCTVTALLVLTGTVRHAATTRAPGDPFDFLKPLIVVSEEDRRRLDDDQVLVEVLPGGDRQLGMFVASRLRATPDAVAVWTRAIAESTPSRHVLASGRFSAVPAPSDLDALVVDDDDLEALRECVPGDCALKLSAPEMASARRSVALAGANWHEAVQDEFKRLLVSRVRTYTTGGLPAVPPVADGRTADAPHDIFVGLTSRSPYLRHLPGVAAWLRGDLNPDRNRIESFISWSKETYGSGKAVISMTHVGVQRYDPQPGRPEVVVTAKQIFATHYIEGSLGLTMVLREPGASSSYLVYVHRSQLDLLQGIFSGITRGLIERRVKDEAPTIVQSIRQQLERGAHRRPVD